MVAEMSNLAIISKHLILWKFLFDKELVLYILFILFWYFSVGPTEGLQLAKFYSSHLSFFP